MTVRLTARDDLLAVLLALPRDRRHIVALAGPPAAGKSTLADWLGEALERTVPGHPAVVPMDGFHFDDAVLTARGHLARKGAPHTFDVAGLLSMLNRLRAGEPDVAVPVFDRDLELARAGARIVPARVGVILVEGNYLLLRQSPWWRLRDRFDVTVALSVDLATLETRLRSRWLGRPADEIERRVGGNDLPNARLVLSESAAPDYLLELP